VTAGLPSAPTTSHHNRQTKPKDKLINCDWFYEPSPRPAGFDLRHGNADSLAVRLVHGRLNEWMEQCTTAIEKPGVETDMDTRARQLHTTDPLAPPRNPLRFRSFICQCMLPPVRFLHALSTCTFPLRSPLLFFSAPVHDLVRTVPVCRNSRK